MSGKLGVVSAIKTIEVVSELVVDVVDLLKGGLLGKVSKVVELVQDVTGLVAAAPDALPELLELDAEDAAKIGEASYRAVKKIVEKLKA